jgi:F420-dependent oxidoreductase-like protein
MDISLSAGSDVVSVGEVVARVRLAADEGFGGFWLPQTASVDALTALAVAGREVGGIRLGTAVVPIQGRHPIPLAQSALTVADAVGAGRLTLGVGVTHKVVSEGWFGVPYRDVVGLCGEELLALSGLLSAARKAEVSGRFVSARIELAVKAPAAPGLVVAALGPKMLALAGAYTDGTVTSMTGARTLAEHIVPALRAAAEQAGRPAPRVIVGLNVCITSDVERARARIAPAMNASAQFATYRRTVALEGVAEPVDIALIGSEDEARSRIDALEHAGMTELIARVQGDPDEAVRTRAFLRTCAD